MTTTPTNEPLAAFSDRLIRLLDAADEVKADLKELRTEIKSAGFDPAALLRVAQLARDDLKRQREEERLQAVTLYASRLGVQLSLAID